MKRKLPLTPHLKLDRVELDHDYQTWDHEWRTILFIDKKKFNLDGSNGYQYYWYDLRKEAKEIFSLVQCSGSVMVWDDFFHLKNRNYLRSW